MNDFQIVLDNNKNVYTAGETVSGHVAVGLPRLGGDIEIKSIRILMRGSAQISWTQRSGNHSRLRREEEDYFRMYQVLIGRDENEGGLSQTLPAGLHRIPFVFQIPHGRLPTSFESSTRLLSIRYWLEAVVDIPKWYGFGRKEKQLAFTLIDHVNVDTPELLTPQRAEREETVCCGPLCFGGNVSVSIQTDRRGYCSGESIAISAEFQNTTGQWISPTATLVQRLSSVKSNGPPTRCTVVARLEGDRIRPRTTATWNNELLGIPLVAPNILSCGLMRVEYGLTMSVSSNSPCKVHVHLPIVVGTGRWTAPASPFNL